MPGRQAKTLSSADVNDLLIFASCTRDPLRNRVIVLLSAKAGLRAGEIANLTWAMVVGPTGQISGSIELHDTAAKKGSGRMIPIHPELRAALENLRRVEARSEYVVTSERGRAMTPPSIVVWFNRAFRTDWPARLLVPFRPTNVCHPRGAVGAQSWRLVARCPAVGRSSVDPDDAAVHRRRQRRAAQTGRDDLSHGRHGDNSATSDQRSKISRKAQSDSRNRSCGSGDLPRLLSGRVREPNRQDFRADLAADGVRTAMRKRDTAAVFDWLIAALSYQGIADQIAYDYMEQHGYVRWDDINQKLADDASCPKLRSYWHFTTATTPSSVGPAPSPITSAAVRCRPMTCATAASTRPPMRCTCSFVTLRMEI